MKLGRAIADAALRVPGLAPVVLRIQNELRKRRVRQRLSSMAADNDFSFASSSDVFSPSQLGGFQAAPIEYACWIAAHEYAAARETGLPAGPVQADPLISVVLPVYRVKTSFLSRTLESLASQTFDRWEACLACADPDNADNRRLLEQWAARDPRFRVVFLERNEGISANSNAALAMARGEFVALLDHDDELAPRALADMAAAIVAEPEADFLYSDKDCIDADSTLRQNPLFKPSWSPEILYSVNYLTHFNVIRRDLVNAVGGFRSETDGAQDWDIFLRVCERARKVVRVPGVHYHWRIHQASTSTGIAAKPYAAEGQIRAIEDHVARLGLPARVVPHDDSGFHLRWRLPADLAIHVIIDAVGAPADRSPALARQVIGTARAAGCRCTVTVIGDGAPAAAAADQDGVRFLAAGSGGLPSTANQAISGRLAETDVVVFLSARATGLSEGWLHELTGWVGCHPEIGFASGLVLDADGTVVEAGLVVDRFGNGSPLFRGSPLRQWGWFGGPLWYRNCTAASPWAVAVGMDAWLAAGGFDERLDWQDAFVELCRSIHRNGRRGVVTPHARVALEAGELPPVPEFHESLRDDPYFHPAFAKVVPLSLDVSYMAHPRPSSSRRQRRRKNSKTVVSSSYAEDALALANICGVSLADLQVPQQHPERVGRGAGAGWCNWYLPEFENPFYGGVMTILRFADYLRRSQGLRQRFLIAGNCDAATIGDRIAAAFPGLAGTPVIALDSAERIAAIPAADYSFATLWTTAYVLQKVRNTGLKFYFIQDWEPLFYPAGSTSAQADLTYDFGFYGIANTQTLRRLYEDEHGGTATHFVPQVDPTVFHGSPLRDAGGPRRIFFYGRPGHPRNGFELAAVALRDLKSRLGDRVQILCAGAPWNPRDYGLEGVIESLGLLEYRQTAELYRSCHIGFVMMMTRHPSYLPFEFMGCGGLLVSNDNRANHWLLDDGVNCLLAPPSGPAIADRLAYAVEHFDDLLAVRRRGWDTIRQRHSNWDTAFDDVWRFMHGLAAEPDHFQGMRRLSMNGTPADTIGGPALPMLDETARLMGPGRRARAAGDRGPEPAAR
jgi:hypothetical protein